MITADIVELALQITFDSHKIQSCLELEELETKLRRLLADSNVEVEELSLQRFLDMEPDTGLSLLWLQWRGTTLRPWQPERFQRVIADHLNGIQELQDSHRLTTPGDIGLRILYRKHSG